MNLNMNRNIVRHRGHWVDGLLVWALTIGSVCSSFAVTFVDWGGDYVTESQVLVNTEVTSEHYRTYDPTPSQGYNTLRGTVLSYGGGIQELTPATGYQAPVGKSSSFWGGWTASAGTGPGIPGGISGNVDFTSNRTVWNNPVAGTGGDFINLSISSSAPAIRGIIAFAKTGFLSGFDAQSVAFDSSSSISLTGMTSGFRPVVRWVIQDGDTWYISENSFTGTGTGFWGAPTNATLNDPNSALWAAYVPILTDSAGPYFYNPAPETGYATHAFTNIQTVGVFFDSYGQPVIDGAYSGFGLQNFTVNGVIAAVPEPSTSLLAAAGALGLGWMRFRRLRNR